MKTKIEKRYRIVEMTDDRHGTEAGRIVHAEIGWDSTMEYDTFETEDEAEAWFCDNMDKMKFGREYIIVAYFAKRHNY